MSGFKRVFTFKQGGGDKEKTRGEMEEGGYKIEETQMTDDFKQKRQKYTEYGIAVPLLTRALAFIIHPAPIELIDGDQPADGQVAVVDEEDKGKTPMEIFATGIETLIEVDNDDPKDKKEMEKPIKQMTKMAKIVEQAADITQQHEDIMRFAMRPLRHFNLADGPLQGFQTAMQNFDEAKEKMDICKCDVKNAPNMAEMEKRALVLKKVVEDFDTKCTVAVGYMDQLPKITELHSNNFSTAFELHRAYHQEMAEKLQTLKLDGF